jgi:hypothetical protein
MTASAPAPDADLAELIFERLGKIEAQLQILIQGESNVATTLQQLDAAIAAEGAEETTLAGAVTSLATLITQLGTDINALIAAVQAGQDFTNELNAVNANLATATATATSVANVTTAAQADDTAVTGETGQLGGGQSQAKPA